MLEKTFLVIMEQAGEGCDYTIGCGLSYSIYKAPSAEDAFNKWVGDNDLDLPDEPGIFEHMSTGERELSRVRVIEVNRIHDKFWPEFVARRTAEIKNQENKDVENAERMEFERLKQKFG